MLIKGYNMQNNNHSNYATGSYSSNQSSRQGNQSRANNNPRSARPSQMNQRRSDSTGGSSKPEDSPVKYFEAKAFGGKAALTVVQDKTRKGVPTIRFETASGGNRQYNWSNKIAIQLTASELLEVAAVLLGIIPYCAFDLHGEGKNKWFEIENQTKNMFFRMGMKGENAVIHALPITIGDAYPILQMVLFQIGNRYKDFGARFIAIDTITMLKATYGPLAGEYQQKLAAKKRRK